MTGDQVVRLGYREEFSVRDIEPSLRRTPKKQKTDWAEIRFILGLALVAAVWGVTCFFAGAFITANMRHPQVAFATQVEAQGKMTTLGVVCARAASEGGLSGDLLTYCK